jgi:hypothetical protein
MCREVLEGIKRGLEGVSRSGLRKSLEEIDLEK